MDKITIDYNCQFNDIIFILNRLCSGQKHTIIEMEDGCGTTFYFKEDYSLKFDDNIELNWDSENKEFEDVLEIRKNIIDQINLIKNN